MPGCFTAHQRRLSVRFVDNMEQVLVADLPTQGNFSVEHFSDRLVVVLADKIPEWFSLDLLKESWRATEVVHLPHVSRLFGNNDKIDCIAGSEFQSVLFILKCCEYDQRDFSSVLNLVVSRAQYEAGIMVVKEDQSHSADLEQLLESYLSSESSNPSTLSDQFHTNPPSNTGWLQPTDTNIEQWSWWSSKLQRNLRSDSQREIDCIRRQPITVRMQLVYAFPSLFKRCSDIGLDGKNLHGEFSILTNEEANTLDRDTISSLNLLYWNAIASNFEGNLLTDCIQFLRQRNLLSREINKGYPSATIIHLVPKIVRRNLDGGPALDVILKCKELQMSTFLQKFGDKNLFEFCLSESKTDLFARLFGDPSRCDLFFMDYIGFESGEREETRLEKYQKWGGDILFNAIDMKSFKALLVAVKVLRRYEHLLDFELNRTKKDLTLLQHLNKTNIQKRVIRLEEDLEFF